MTRRSIVGALLLLSPACAERNHDTDSPAGVDTTGGAETTGGETEGAAVLSPAGFGRRFAQAACAKVFDCCSPVDVRRLFLTFPEEAVSDRSACEEFHARKFDRFVRGVAGSALEGRSEWDGEAAAACVERLNAMSCDEYSALVRPHDAGMIACRVLTGKVSPAGACRSDGECIRGFCRGAAQWQEGACAELPAVGEVCPDDRCEAGARCDWATAPGVCAALKADGEACRSDDECRSNGCSAPVFGAGECGEPRVCDGDPADDEDVIATCVLDQGDARIQCKLGGADAWSCDCLERGEVEAHCSPGLNDPHADVCRQFNCCP
ncbi:hypothetical protein [Nannocystis punicea]|uniref:Dickkopf N-terminal cysteine-rich domain-containing protein n=1 Tax=Nannocystis punicea TaxID=2995304 RepID=A0ABY7HA42_9BACT|nr:hypothetical protein [Nannocystis poenicansa]WAS95972.1 hypothetical protein O0S08_07385 [Nannocystis poenicansa]